MNNTINNEPLTAEKVIKELTSALKMCHSSLCTYGSHPIIDTHVNFALDYAQSAQQEEKVDAELHTIKIHEGVFYDLTVRNSLYSLNIHSRDKQILSVSGDLKSILDAYVSIQHDEPSSRPQQNRNTTPVASDLPSNEWIRTKAESLALEPSASPSDWDYIAKYIRIGIKEMRSEAEKALAYERWKAQMFAEWTNSKVYCQMSKLWDYDPDNEFEVDKTTAGLYNGEEFKEYLEKRRKEYCI